MKNAMSALARFRDIMGPVEKSAVNPHFKSSYVPLEELLDAIAAPLKECGLLCTFVLKGKMLELHIVHIESMETVVGEMELRPAKDDPQGWGSAITYARRYMLQTMLNLKTEDDDGNAASPRHAPVPSAHKEPSYVPVADAGASPPDVRTCPKCRSRHRGKYDTCWDCYSKR